MSIHSLDGLGESAAKPRVLGKPNDAEAVFVEATGLYEGVPKGQQLWVTGDKVSIGLTRGNIVAIDLDGSPTLVRKVTRVSNTEPPLIKDSAPWHPTEPATEPEPEPEPEPVAVDPDAPYNPANYTAKQVIAYIEEHPDEAGAVLAAERAGQNRKTIIREFS